MSRAGEWELVVSEPYPCWVEIRHDGKRLGSMHHSELTDLRYAIDKAIREAKEKMARDRWHEIE